MLGLNTKKVPEGWSSQARDLLTGRSFPPCWVGSKPARKTDIKALANFQGQDYDDVWVDKLSLVGKRSPGYTTASEEYRKQYSRRTRVWMFFKGVK